MANVTLGSETYDISVRFDGKSAVFMNIKVAPNANLLTVADGVRKVFPSIEQQLPEGLDGRIVYDATKYVNSSIREVITTLVEALLIVTLVIFLSLGSVRSVIIPTVAIPLSLVGAFFIMLALGYTINLMTLLALVLAIGLVVDDAIIVVENVHRHMEDGVLPLQVELDRVSARICRTQRCGQRPAWDVHGDRFQRRAGRDGLARSEGPDQRRGIQSVLGAARGGRET